MQEFLFILGREPALSKAEITARLGCELRTQDQNTAIVELDALPDPQKFLDRLGGIIKIGRIIEPSTFDGLIEYCKTFFKGAPHKIEIGFSFMEMGFPEQCRMRKKIMNLKKTLATEGIKGRIIFQPGQQVPAAAIRGQHLTTEKGRDFTILSGNAQKPFRIAETLAIQNIDAYSRRDYAKPVRDTHRGMLPPKLAQMMISFACGTEKADGKTVYDPFCGSGVVLMEAMLQGYKVIGSDIDQKAVEDTEKNLTWLQKAKLVPETSSFKLFKKDAALLTIKDFPTKPDLIVSEVDLGEPPSTTITRTHATQLLTAMDKEYTAVLERLRQIVNKDGTIVLALPVYYTSEGMIRLPTIGSKAKSILSYHRPDQMVGREIMVF